MDLASFSVPPTPMPAPAPGSSGPLTSPHASDLCEELVPLGFHGAVAEFKRRILAKTIARCGGNRSEAARLLGLQRTYLYRLTRQLGDGSEDSANLV